AEKLRGGLRSGRQPTVATASPLARLDLDCTRLALSVARAANGPLLSGKGSSNRELLRRKPKHLVLAGPFGRQGGEADYSHAMRKPSFDRRLDEVGREEGK